MSHVIKKKNFLVKKFGYLKAMTKILTQTLSFKNKLDSMYKAQDMIINIDERLQYTVKIFDYLQNTLDIWTETYRFLGTVRNKTFELASQYSCFKKYVYIFGFACPYPKRNGVLCDSALLITCYEGLCKRHFDCKKRLKKRIGDSIRHLPVDVCNVIFKYAIPH